MKRMVTTFLMIFCLSTLLSGCGKVTNHDSNKSNSDTFTGTILEINEESILVEPLEGEDILKSADKISVNTKGIELPEDFIEGNVVEIIYSGEILESYPAQINDVSGINIVDGLVDKKEAWDRIPMIMINGVLYYDTGNESDIEARCGVMDGEITSTVDSTETPTEDNQSNFGEGYGYQYVDGNSIDVYMNEKWIRFVKDK
ncbi:DUF3221 domain-containing protein [Tissierella sp. Yu-01]|uniref:DUF3221 domain-containing protein n=1 Tax=Tissierella sp. Yu-01 TaxID=3035694 RepID=UPI00240D6C0F|nr:DUF3221 domain-containing protein [Tissierella sp. Yu-01]WFA09300.1 hypothetical protein P3962_01625 [Tissierella sp. Yu-01]